MILANHVMLYIIWYHLLLIFLCGDILGLSCHQVHHHIFVIIGSLITAVNLLWYIYCIMLTTACTAFCNINLWIIFFFSLFCFCHYDSNFGLIWKKASLSLLFLFLWFVCFICTFMSSSLNCSVRKLADYKLQFLLLPKTIGLGTTSGSSTLPTLYCSCASTCCLLFVQLSSVLAALSASHLFLHINILPIVHTALKLPAFCLKCSFTLAVFWILFALSDVNCLTTVLYFFVSTPRDLISGILTMLGCFLVLQKTYTSFVFLCTNVK